MKKLAASILLLGLFSTSQAEDTYYVPIQNLVPIGYNPLTTNYNPDYDNYTWLAPAQTVQQISSTSATTSKLDSEYKKAESDYTGKDLNALKNATNLGDFFAAAIKGNQDRQTMNRVTQIQTGQAPVTVVNQTFSKAISTTPISTNCSSVNMGYSISTSCNSY